MPPRPLDDEKPDRILDAALTLFNELGFHGTTVPQVADYAKVGAGTIYRYFANKEALVNALYRKHKEAIASHVLKDFPFHEKPRAQFLAVWNRMAEWALKHRREFAFLELHHHASYLDDASRAVEQQMLGFARSMIEEAEKSGAIHEFNAEALIALVQGAFVGLFRAGQQGAATVTRYSLEKAGERVWHMLAGR